MQPNKAADKSYIYGANRKFFLRCTNWSLECENYLRFPNKVRWRMGSLRRRDGFRCRGIRRNQPCISSWIPSVLKGVQSFRSRPRRPQNEVPMPAAQEAGIERLLDRPCPQTWV